MEINQLQDRLLAIRNTWDQTQLLERRLTMVEYAVDAIGTGFTRDYLTVAQGAWSGDSPPAWCGLFALYMAHRASLLTTKKWIWGKGFLLTPPALRIVPRPAVGDIAYFSHFSHHAICLPVNDESDEICLINGNGRAGLVSLSTVSASSDFNGATFFDINEGGV